MPRNTLSILIRFQGTIANLNCVMLSCQDIIELNRGKIPEATDGFFDMEKLEDSNTDYEGDELKVILNYENPDEKKEVAYYNLNLQNKFKEYLSFLEQANLKEIQPVRVLHCPQAHGVVITSNYGKFMSIRVENHLQWRLQAK